MTLPIGTTLHRARDGFVLNENDDRIPFSGTNIGAPPVEKARAGRANVKGQAVLYVGDQEKTAIAEVRPLSGSYVSVASISLTREARILDLTRGRLGVNPFTSENPSWAVEIDSLLESFSEEMAKPLERKDDESHYVPYQRLSKYIADAGYHGIRYPSALNPSGTNVVLFDVTVGEVRESKLAKITEVTFEYEIDDTPTLEQRLRRAAEEWNNREVH